MIPRTDLFRILTAAIAIAVAGCAGAPPPEREAAATTAAAAGEADTIEDLIARLDVLIATSDGDTSLQPALLAEARALRSEAIAAMANGDEALARDFIHAAIALFGEPRG